MSKSPAQDTMIIYGRNPIIDAIHEGKSFEKIFVRDTLTGEYEKEVRKLCKEHDISLKKVPQAKLDRLSRRANHQGVVGIGSIISYQDIGDIIPHLYENGASPLIVLLDNVQDVRNIGAIARSTEALGGHVLIMSGKKAGMITSESLKSSAGALARLYVCRERNTIATIQVLQEYGIKVIGTSVARTELLSDIEMSAPLCLCLGSEGEGLHQSVLEACDSVGHIPQIGETESLNISVAAGILLYEVRRQLK